MKKNAIFILLILIIFSCGKHENDVLKKAKKIKFDKWNEAIVPKDSILIAEDKIANIKKGLFRSSINAEILKNAYLLKDYQEDKIKKNKIIKDNITIEFILIDEQNINIMIDIR